MIYPVLGDSQLSSLRLVGSAAVLHPVVPAAAISIAAVRTNFQMLFFTGDLASNCPNCLLGRLFPEKLLFGQAKIYIKNYHF